MLIGQLSVGSVAPWGELISKEALWHPHDGGEKTTDMSPSTFLSCVR